MRMRLENVLRTHLKNNSMSKFDYCWNKAEKKDGISFSEAIKIFNLERGEAKKCLKSAKIPIISDDDNLSLRQFEFLRRKANNELLSSREFLVFLEKMTKEEKDGRTKCMKYVAAHGLPTIGINNHRVESRTVLRERLEEIAKSPTEHFPFDGAMCYSRRFPNVEVTIEHKCPTCGTIYKYKTWGFDEKDNNDRYVDEDERVDKYVKEIKQLGYDVFVEHMCKSCYEQKYGKNEQCVSINVLNFKHISDENYTINTVTSHDCMILSEFLKGNNAFKGSQDQTIWINKFRSTIERLLGIKIEE